MRSTRGEASSRRSPASLTASAISGVVANRVVTLGRAGASSATSRTWASAIACRWRRTASGPSRLPSGVNGTSSVTITATLPPCRAARIRAAQSAARASSAGEHSAGVAGDAGLLVAGGSVVAKGAGLVVDRFELRGRSSAHAAANVTTPQRNRLSTRKRRNAAFSAPHHVDGAALALRTQAINTLMAGIPDVFPRPARDPEPTHSSPETALTVDEYLISLSNFRLWQMRHLNMTRHGCSELIHRRRDTSVIARLAHARCRGAIAWRSGSSRRFRLAGHARRRVPPRRVDDPHARTLGDCGASVPIGGAATRQAVDDWVA